MRFLLPLLLLSSLTLKGQWDYENYPDDIAYMADKPQLADSLWQVYQDPEEDTLQRMRALRWYISNTAINVSLDSTVHYGKILMDMAKAREDSFYLAVALNTMALGHAYREEHSKTLSMLYESIAIKKALGAEFELGVGYGNLVFVVAQLGFYDEAIHYAKKSLEIDEKYGHKQRVKSALLNIGAVYQMKEELDSAEYYYRRMFKTYADEPETLMLQFAQGNLGELYFTKGQYDSAQKYLNKMKNIGESFGDFNYTKFLLVYGQLKNALSQYDSAYYYCHQAYSFFDGKGMSEKSAEACRCLWESRVGLGSYRAANQWAERYIKLQDSLDQDRSSIDFQRLEFEKSQLQDSLAFAEEQKKIELSHQKEILETEKERRLAWLSGGFALILALGFAHRWRTLRKTNRLIQDERQRSDQLLLNILPAEVARELKSNGRAAAQRFDEVNILFSDFKDFTPYAESLDPEELVHEMNHYFKAFDAICQEYEVEKIKTIGDSYMAVTGLPSKGAHDAYRLVQAALAMLKVVEDRNVSRTGKPLAMRIGIHTGSVVAGVVGKQKFQYDIWGDAVNVAARMETYGLPACINLSPNTYAQLQSRHDLIIEARAPQKVKGKGEMQMYLIDPKKQSS